MASFFGDQRNGENSDLFFVDVPQVEHRENDIDNLSRDRASQRLQAPPVPGASEALLDEDENAAALAELEDVPMAAKKKRTINRGPKLDTKRLLSARGLPAVESYFKEVKLKGEGHEEEDLVAVMSTFEHWAHRLYPKLTFDDCLEKIESLGHKREIQTCMKRIRMGMVVLDDQNQSTVITPDGPLPADDDDDIEMNNDAPSTSYVDIFPMSSNTPSDRRSNNDEHLSDGGTTSRFTPLTESRSGLRQSAVHSKPDFKDIVDWLPITNKEPGTSFASARPVPSQSYPAGFGPADYGAGQSSFE